MLGKSHSEVREPNYEGWMLDGVLKGFLEQESNEIRSQMKCMLIYGESFEMLMQAPSDCHEAFC